MTGHGQIDRPNGGVKCFDHEDGVLGTRVDPMQVEVGNRRLGRPQHLGATENILLIGADEAVYLPGDLVDAFMPCCQCEVHKDVRIVGYLFPFGGL